MDKPKIYVAIPHYGNIHYLFFRSYVKMALTVNKQTAYECLLDDCYSCSIAGNRNNLVKSAIQAQATHVLFIDSDMTFPEDVVSRLLNHNKDIVCATASRRVEQEAGKPIGEALSPICIENKLIKMHNVGSCCMMIKIEVFKKIGLPAYYDIPSPATGNVVTEDKNFCLLALKNGYDIWLDPYLSKEIGHIGHKIYYITENIIL